MTCLIKGCNFVLKNIPHEAFMYQKDSDPEFRFQTNHPNIFPYLLVNIGSGVSIVKVRVCRMTAEWLSTAGCVHAVSQPSLGMGTGVILHKAVVGVRVASGPPGFTWKSMAETLGEGHGSPDSQHPSSLCGLQPSACPPLPQVETEDRFEWIGGSSIGGGTFWGLGALLTKTKVPC